MRVRIKHRTAHFYDDEVALGPHIIRMRPAEHTRARLLSYNLAVEPAPDMRWQDDPWGNRIARLSFPDRTRQLVVTVDPAFYIRPLNPFDFFIAARGHSTLLAQPAPLPYA